MSSETELTFGGSVILLVKLVFFLTSKTPKSPKIT